MIRMLAYAATCAVTIYFGLTHMVNYHTAWPERYVECLIVLTGGQVLAIYVYNALTRVARWYDKPERS